MSFRQSDDMHTDQDSSVAINALRMVVMHGRKVPSCVKWHDRMINTAHAPDRAFG